MNYMTDHEKGEILDYHKIYFLGIQSKKIRANPNNPHNFGFDDERGDYNVALYDHISYRYEVLQFLGKGSFGQVRFFQEDLLSYFDIRL
jgi:dual specificity tyrosine-phosphorylation-regulated kinase 2/3/4